MKTAELIELADCPLYVRYGFGWKGAEWSRTTKDAIAHALERGDYAHYDICNVFDGIGISFYSANDMT